LSEESEDNGTPLQDTARDGRRKVKTTEHHSRLQQEIVGVKRRQRNTEHHNTKIKSQDIDEKGERLM
jgi:hypothetical protein